MKDWIYDEFTQVRVDYSQENTVHDYDHEMERFRDYEQEAHAFLDKLQISNPQELTVIDIGCGTGAFAIHASKYFKRIYAVDVSQEMLQAVSAKARVHTIKNIECCHSGFLQFQPPEKADIIHSKWAFHHLPDYWKQAGLLNMNSMLKPGGMLFLADLVFQFAPHYETNIDMLIDELAQSFSEEFVGEVKIHIRDEYSTFDWVLEGFMKRAGFKIEHSNTADPLASEYICRKIQSFDHKSQ
jgi:ubiquinone/menaquinone biosynthesis C-methylase UbiE